MVEISQQLHLTQGSQAEHRVVEGRDLLDGDFLPRRLVDSGASRCQWAEDDPSVSILPDNSVGTFTDDILDFILVGDVEGDLARPSLGRQLLHHGC